MTETTPSQVLTGHRGAILRYVTGIVRDPVEAEDLTQEVLLRAHRAVVGLRDPDRLLPWLYRIATNLCRDRFRAEARTAAVVGSADDGEVAGAPDDLAPRLDQVAECAEMSECVQRYVARLPDDYRAVILLHDAEGLTNAEIAQMLGISVPAAKIRLHRARAKLRALLQDACEFGRDQRDVFVCEPKDS